MKIPPLAPLTACAAALLAFSSAHASTLYWDSDATGTGNNIITGAGLGGTGNWNNSLSGTPLLNWWPGTGTTDQAWVNANNDTAAFWGTAGTVSLTDSVIVGGLQFKTTGYTLDASANALTFGAASTIEMNAIAAATITGSVTGSGSVSLIRSSSNTGVFTAATLNMNGTSAAGWSGATTVGNGTTLALSAGNQALVSTSGITLNGGTISLTNVAAEASLDRVSGAAIISNGGTITYANTATASTAYTESIGSVALTAGQLNVSLSNNQNASTNSQTLTLGGLTRGSNNSTVFFSATGGLNATTNVIKVTGATATTAGQIIGPWATVGTSATAQTDYAVYDGSGNILGANITASAENAWASGATANNTLSGASTLTAGRNMTSLRYTGGAQTLALGAFNLDTNGILNGGSGLLTISGTGFIRQQGTAASDLYINTGNNAITINSIIANNTGALSLVKSGNGTLTLGANNTYTGTTTVLSGTLSATGAGSIDGNLFIGSIGGGAAATFTNTGTSVIADSATITVYRNGTLNLNGGEIIGNLVVIGGTATSSFSYTNGSITMTGGTLTNGWYGTHSSITTNASADTAVFSTSQNSNTKSVTVADGAATVDLLITGSLVTGAGGITKNGAGLMQTSGGQNGTGTTTVNGGAFQAGRAVNAFGSSTSAVVLANTAGVILDLNGFDNTIGSLATGGTTGGNVTLGTATLSTGGANTNTSYAGVISGSGGVTKIGTGTQTLTGLNTYTGSTTVNGGTLVVDTATNATVLNSSSGLVVGGGAFQLKGKVATVQTQILNGLTVNVGNGVVDVNNLGTSTTLDLSGVSGTAGITHIAGGTVDFKATTGTFGTTAIVKTAQANDSTGILGTWATVNGGADFAANNGSNVIVAYAGYTALDAQAGGSNPILNDGTTLNYRINAAGVSGPITLGSPTTNINSLSQNFSTASIIDTTSGTLRVGTVGGLLITPSGADLTIGTSAGAGTLTAGGNATDVAGELVLTNNSANTLSINSNVTDNGTGLVSLTKSGSGLATLAGTNTFTGGVAINAGVLQLSSAGALNATPSNAVTFGATSTGTLRLNGNSVTILGLDTNAIPGSPVVENASATGATLTVSKASGTSTYAGVVQNGTGGGALSLTKNGAGLLVLSGTNTYTGATTVNGGTLKAASSSALGSNSVVTMANVSGAVLDLSSASPQLGSLTGGGAAGGNVTIGLNTLTIGGDNTSPAAYAGVISGTGELVKIGTGTLILSGANSFTGAQTGNVRMATVKAGTLVVGANALASANGALGNSAAGVAVLVGDTAGTQNASLLTNGAFTIGHNITVQAGNTGVITLGGNQTGGTSIYSAGVTLAKDVTLTSAAGGEVDFNGTVSGAFSAIIDGGGTVKLAGAGNTFGAAGKSITIQNATTLLAGVNANLGNASNSLIFSNGTLKFGAAFDPTTRTVTFNSGGATFDTNSQTVTFANAVGNSGTGGLTKTGAGTLNLNAANTYTGATTISSGTLVLASGGTIAGSSGVNLGTSGSQGTLDLSAKASGFTLGTSQTLSGYGNVTMASGQTLTVNGGLAPGNSPGVIAITGNLALGSTATTTMELIDNTLAAGTGFDQIALSGTTPTLTYDGTLTLNVTLATKLGVYHLFTGFGSNQSGSFTGGINYSLVGAAGSFDYTTGDLNLTAVPEPATWGLLAFSMTAVLVLRRRKA